MRRWPLARLGPNRPAAGCSGAPLRRLPPRPRPARLERERVHVRLAGVDGSALALLRGQPPVGVNLTSEAIEECGRGGRGRRPPWACRACAAIRARSVLCAGVKPRCSTTPQASGRRAPSELLRNPSGALSLAACSLHGLARLCPRVDPPGAESRSEGIRQSRTRGPWPSATRSAVVARASTRPRTAPRTEAIPGRWTLVGRCARPRSVRGGVGREGLGGPLRPRPMSAPGRRACRRSLRRAILLRGGGRCIPQSI